MTMLTNLLVLLRPLRTLLVSLLCSLVRVIHKIVRLKPKLSLVFGIILTACLWVSHASPATAQSPSAQIIEQQQAIAKAYDEAVSEAIGTLVDTPVFKEACNVGVYLAIAGFFPVLLAVARAFNHDDEIDVDRVIEQLFILSLVLILLGTPTDRGRLLADVLTGTNNVVNVFSEKILYDADGENAVNAVANEIVKNNAESVTESGLQSCAKQAEKGLRQACYGAVNEVVEKMLEPHLEQQWAKDTLADLQEKINAEAEFGLEYGAGEWAIRLTDGSFDFGIIKGICWAMGQVFVIGTEHIKAIMVLMAPIFLGLQMAPLFKGFFATWLKNFLMIELAQLFFNLIIAFIAITMLTARGASTLVFPLLVACLSIVFALVMTGGGGISLYTQAASTASGVFSAARRVFK